jgi:16S rRNA (uracil1498-N3)-methyltransferase
MSTHRFYLAPTQWASGRPQLDESDSHHCADVLRLAVGDPIVIFDGQGTVAEAELLEVHRKHCSLRIGQRHQTPALRCAITLIQAVPKGKNMDLILQKAVELGAAEIVPLISARTVVRIDDHGEADRKQERWQQIALEACKQCGRNSVPLVVAPVSLEGFLGKLPDAELLLLASLQPGAKTIKEVLSEHQHSAGGLPVSVAVIVGPEGDFTPGEIALLKEARALPITLGPTILRAETAALYSLSVLGHELL